MAKDESDEVRGLWEQFDRNAALSDGEIVRLIESAEQGLKFCHERGVKLVSSGVVADLETLRGWQFAREESHGRKIF